MMLQSPLTVTVTPLLIVIGPTDTLFQPDGMVKLDVIDVGLRMENTSSTTAIFCSLSVFSIYMERVARIELAIKLWQSFRLPLHHTRLYS